MKKAKSRGWSESIKAIIAAAIIAYLLKTFIFSTSIVEGESMDPTLSHGERIVFNKLIYYLDEPKHNDIVIIQKGSRNYVKRLVALPGDTIEMIDHTLYLNGTKTEQVYISEELQEQTGNFGPYTLPKEYYFVLGDNRPISKDSRNGLGLIHHDEIIGKSEFIYYPLTEWSLTR